MKKVLFLSHDAHRTGAPRSLLYLLQWLKANSDLEFCILFKDGGILQEEFENLGLIGTFNSRTEPSNKLIDRLSRRLFSSSTPEQKRLEALRNKLLNQNIGLIYANTIANGEVLDFLADFLKCPVICHVRELEQMLYHHVGITTFEKTQKYTSHYIAVSHAVKENLIENHNIPENRINVIYNSIPDKFLKIDRLHQSREQIIESLGIPTNSKIVCASGTTDWRKGPDLFIQLAKSCLQKYYEHPVHFVWVGGATSGSELSQLLHDVDKAHLTGKVHFLGSRANPLDFYAACDIFALVSREDPFPRVCLEAASLGKPIVCFEGAGGEEEFVEDDCGFVIPYLDIQTMSDKIISLFENSLLYKEMSDRALQKVKERHNSDLISNQVLQVIKRFI